MHNQNSLTIAPPTLPRPLPPRRPSFADKLRGKTVDVEYLKSEAEDVIRRGYQHRGYSDDSVTTHPRGTMFLIETLYGGLFRVVCVSPGGLVLTDVEMTGGRDSAAQYGMMWVG